MNLPFTIEEFLKVFEKYNLSVWPMQLVLVILALITVFFAARKRSFSGKYILLTLSFFWFWMGIVYHFLFFSVINKTAHVFGVLFIMQGILFFIASLKKNSFALQKNIYSLVAILFIVFALIIYPLTGYFIGHVYPSSPTFGLPCPTTIFTFGMLLLLTQKCHLYLLIIPFIWSIIGFTAAISLGIKEDTGLLVAGLITAVLIPLKNKRVKLSNLA